MPQYVTAVRYSYGANANFQQRAGGSPRSHPAKTRASPGRLARRQREKGANRPDSSSSAARQSRYRARCSYRFAGTYGRTARAAAHQRPGSGYSVQLPMRYLLDVNALVALGFLEHEFHGRVARWVLRLGKGTRYQMLTCAITERGSSASCPRRRNTE